MPKKLSLFVLEHERTALRDGRVVEKVHVKLRGGASYQWQCVCAGAVHDHTPFIEQIAEGLAHREQVLPELDALRGRKLDSGAASATITDANIQMWGPADWRLYLGWKYENGEERKHSQSFASPLDVPAPDVVLKVATDEVAATGARLAVAAAHVEFAGETSDPVEG